MGRKYSEIGFLGTKGRPTQKGRGRFLPGYDFKIILFDLRTTGFSRRSNIFPTGQIRARAVVLEWSRPSE